MKEITVVKTLMLCFTLLSLVFAAFVFYIHYSRRKSFRGDIDLGIALILMSGGFLVNTFNLLGTPELSMTVSNVLAVSGYIVFNWGTRKFRDIPVNYKLDISTLVVYTILYMVFMYGVDIKTIRLMITSFFLSFYTILILVQYTKHIQSNTIIQTIKLAFTLFFIINMVRFFVYATKGLQNDFSINGIVEIVWLANLLLTEMVVFTGMLVIRDQDELQHKNMLLSVLGHDLKTPLITVHNISSLLLEKDYPSEDKEMLKMCNKASHNGMNLLSNIVEWSKFDMNEFNKASLCSSQELKEKIENYFAPQAEIHAVKIDIRAVENFLITIDERILHTVLRNVIGNAIQYSPTNETVILEMLKTEKEYEFRVSDNGEGIPEEQLLRLNLSTPSLSPRSASAKGSGLGFFIIRKFMSALNGRIHVQHNVPQGTVFTLSFPIGL